MKRFAFVSIVVLAFFLMNSPGVAGETGEPSNPEMSYGGEAIAEIDKPVIPIFTGHADDAWMGRVPDHPPIDQIPHMPMPPMKEGEGAGNQPLSHSAVSRETVNGLMPPASGLASDFGGGWPGPFVDENDFAEESPKTYGSMSNVTGSAGSSYARKNAKLVMKYTTDTGGTAWYVCSGSMQDAEVVLTAGHCVFSREANIMDWADEIWVYPGWDGVGSTSTATTIENYGYGVGTNFSAWTSWTQNGETNFDVGLIRIERAVGMITGDWGWAWGQSCASIQGRTTYNLSYPAENCPDTGYHNGRRLFQWGGSVDDCDVNNKLHLVTTGGCFDALWGGSSGSAMYYVDTNRYALAVASTSNRFDSAYYARLWEGMVDYMNDTIIPAARGTSLDLQMMDFKVSESSITAGDSVTNTSFFMANPTNATALVTNWQFNVYLSTNELISQFDMLLQDTFVQRAFAAMQAYTVSFSVQPTVPLNTPSGTYWMGVRLDAGSDVEDGNNDSSYWDAHPITVNGVADVSADYLSAPSGTFETGESLALSYNIDNLGGDPSNSITVDIRASTNEIISTGDRQLGFYVLPGLTGSGTTTRYPTVTIPAMPTDTYYIGMIIDSSDDVNSSNNTTHDAVAITVINTLIFSDGFESGTMGSWDSTVP